MPGVETISWDLCPPSKRCSYMHALLLRLCLHRRVNQFKKLERTDRPCPSVARPQCSIFSALKMTRILGLNNMVNLQKEIYPGSRS